VTDAGSCSATFSVNVSQPSALVLNTSVTHVTCAGDADGSIDVTVQGGVFPYTYLWSNGLTAEDINGLSGGMYDVTVIDANSCSVTATFTVNEPTEITSSVSGTNISCFGTSSGSAVLTVG